MLFCKFSISNNQNIKITLILIIEIVRPEFLKPVFVGITSKKNNHFFACRGERPFAPTDDGLEDNDVQLFLFVFRQIIQICFHFYLLFNHFFIH